MHFFYTERGGSKEYAIIRDGAPAQIVDPGIIVDVYKQALGNPKFLWPDFYDRVVIDANENATQVMRGTANFVKLVKETDPKSSPFS